MTKIEFSIVCCLCSSYYHWNNHNQTFHLEQKSGPNQQKSGDSDTNESIVAAHRLIKYDFVHHKTLSFSQQAILSFLM